MNQALAAAGAANFSGRAQGNWKLAIYDPTPLFWFVAFVLGIAGFADRIEGMRRRPWARRLRLVTAWKNIVTTEGGNSLLSVGLAGGAQIAAWYIGLTATTPTVAAGDTMASHAGWTEVQAYSEAARQAFTPGAAAAKSIDNSGSVATFTINADGTVIGGAFLTSDSTKGGATGTLYAAGAFSGGDLTLNNGSTLDITATFSV